LVSPVADGGRHDQRRQHDADWPREPPAAELLAEQDEPEGSEQRQAEREHQDPIRREPARQRAEGEPARGDGRPGQQEAPREAVGPEGTGGRERGRHERRVAPPVDEEAVEVGGAQRRQLSGLSQEGVGRGLPLHGRAAEGRRPQADHHGRSCAADGDHHPTRVRVPREPALVERGPRARAEQDEHADREEPGMRDPAAREQERGGDRAAPCPSRERRGRGEEGGDEHQVRDVPAAEEGRPRSAQDPRGEPAAARKRPPAPARERHRGEADRRSERVLQTAESGDQSAVEDAGHRPDQCGRPGPFARERRAAPLDDARPPQVDRHIRPDRERVVVSQGRPGEHA